MAVSLSIQQWALAVLAALATGLSKGGFVGFGMVAVLLMAEAFPARESTGIVLPMLICADMVAVAAFRQHADWKAIIRLLPPALLGIVVGFWCMDKIPGPAFRSALGWMVLMMVGLQSARRFRGEWFAHVPHTRWFSWLMGGIAGFTTMVANAAGPVATLYLMALNMQKMQFVGTIAWFFCIVNLAKIPFSARLGLIAGNTLTFNLILAPLVIGGVFLGRWLLKYVPQRLYETLLLAFAAIASVRLILT